MNDDTLNTPIGSQTPQAPGAVPFDVSAQDSVDPNPTPVKLPNDNLEDKVPEWENKTAWSADAPEVNPADFTSAKNLEFGPTPEPQNAPEPVSEPIPELAVPPTPVEPEPAPEPAEEPTPIAEPEAVAETTPEVPKETEENPVEVESALDEAVKAREEVEEVKKRAQEEIDTANSNAHTKAEEVLTIIDQAIVDAEKVTETKKADLAKMVSEKQAEIDEIHERVAKLKRKKTEMKNYLGVEEK